MGWLPRRGNLSPHVRQTISETVQETLQSHGQREKERRERSRQSSQGLGKGVRYMRIRELEHPEGIKKYINEKNNTKKE